MSDDEGWAELLAEAEQVHTRRAELIAQGDPAAIERAIADLDANDPASRDQEAWLRDQVRERTGDSYGALAVLDRSLYRQPPPERPWCAAEGRCACFGTVTPSTNLRNPSTAHSRRHREHCEAFRPDGGTTPTLRGMR